MARESARNPAASIRSRLLALAQSLRWSEQTSVAKGQANLNSEREQHSICRVQVRVQTSVWLDYG